MFTTSNDMTASTKVIPIYVVRPQDWSEHKEELSRAHQNTAQHYNFEGKAGQLLTLFGGEGLIDAVYFGVGQVQDDHEGPIRIGKLTGLLKQGYYKFKALPEDYSAPLCAVGWGMGGYKFEAYLSRVTDFPVLVIDAERSAEITSIVEALHLCRNLINMPASDMGPANLEKAAVKLAKEYEAKISVTKGEALLGQNFPMIHAVGRAAHEAPRLVEFEWGDPSHPRLALIGKGITFDTGGVNIKSASGARIMKKDMGGAAHALALTKMIMANNLPIRLHCLVAIAENAISAGAYRPGDILTSREGLTVEIDNTDAEGRLVLADALTKAAEDEPVLMIDFATLTGAARVALGPTLPPFFSNRQNPVEGVLMQAEQQCDPIWHMPLWQPYNTMLSSPIADMKNSGGGFAGSVTAGLFLERFVKGRPWMHFDVYGWNPSARGGHPKGGDMFAVRALYHWLKAGGLNGDFTA